MPSQCGRPSRQQKPVEDMGEATLGVEHIKYLIEVMARDMHTNSLDP